MTYDDTNRGQLWRNQHKEKPTQRDFQGSINIDGKEYWLSGWQRDEGANPKAPIMKLKAELKEESQEKSPPATPDSATPPADWDDDIPF